MIQITVNGQKRDVEEAISLADFLEQAGIQRRMIAVARNDEVIPRREYGTVMLRDGDVLEIVHMVGGG